MIVILSVIKYSVVMLIVDISHRLYTIQIGVITVSIMTLSIVTTNRKSLIKTLNIMCLTKEHHIGTQNNYSVLY